MISFRAARQPSIIALNRDQIGGLLSNCVSISTIFLVWFNGFSIRRSKFPERSGRVEQVRNRPVQGRSKAPGL